MSNGFPKGNFRIINKRNGACLASEHGGTTSGGMDAVTKRGERGVLPYSVTHDRLLTVHDTVEHTEEELWYFDEDNRKLYNGMTDHRGRWVIIAFVNDRVDGWRLPKDDLDALIERMPKQDEDTARHLRSDDCLKITDCLTLFLQLNDLNAELSEGATTFTDIDVNDGLKAVAAYYAQQRIKSEFYHRSKAVALFAHIEDVNTEIGDSFIANLYDIILAAQKIEILGQYDYSFPFDLRLDRPIVEQVLQALKVEDRFAIDAQAREACRNIDDNDKKKEAVKIVAEMAEKLGLPLNTDDDITRTAKVMLQAAQQSKDTYAQLKAALGSIERRKAEPIYSYEGSVALKGETLPIKTMWGYRDGFIHLDGIASINGVLTHIYGTSLAIGPRSSYANQNWACVEA